MNVKNFNICDITLLTALQHSALYGYSVVPKQRDSFVKAFCKAADHGNENALQSTRKKFRLSRVRVIEKLEAKK